MKKKGPWNFQDIVPKGVHKVSTSGTPKGFKKIELYVKVGGVNAPKKVKPIGKSWEQQINEF